MLISKKLTAITNLLILVFFFPTVGSAQLSENEVIQFLPSKSVAVVNLNIEAVLESLGDDADLLEKFRQRKSASLLDFTEVKQRLMVLFDAESDELTPLDSPFLMFDRFADEVDRTRFLESANKQNPEIMIYEPITFDGEDLLVGKYQIDFGGITPSESAFFFPKEDMVALGSLPVIKILLKEQPQNEEVPEFTIDLDLEAEFHLILVGGEKLTRISSFAPFLQALKLSATSITPEGVDLIDVFEALERLEVRFDSGQMTPLDISLRFNSDQTAGQVEQLINMGLQAAPALLAMLEAEPVPSGLDDDFALLIDLVKRSHKDLQVERDGSTIEIKLAGIDGLDKLPAQIARFVIRQQMNIDELKYQFDAVEVELDLMADEDDDQ